MLRLKDTVSGLALASAFCSAVAYTNTYGNETSVGAQMGTMAIQSLYRVIDITTAFAATNTVDIGHLPKGAIPIGGLFTCVDIDTGAETLDLDLGIAANTGIGGSEAADPDFFMNGGVFNGDAITDLVPAGTANYANIRIIGGPFPVTQLSAKTKVVLLCNAVAQAGGTGKIAIRIDYLTPGASTS